jgi:hypothetical protein
VPHPALSKGEGSKGILQILQIKALSIGEDLGEARSMPGERAGQQREIIYSN